MEKLTLKRKMIVERDISSSSSSSTATRSQNISSSFNPTLDNFMPVSAPGLPPLPKTPITPPSMHSTSPDLLSYEKFAAYLSNEEQPKLINLLWSQRQQLLQRDMQVHYQQSEIQKLKFMVHQQQLQQQLSRSPMEQVPTSSPQSAPFHSAYTTPYYQMAQQQQTLSNQNIVPENLSAAPPAQYQHHHSSSASSSASAHISIPPNPTITPVNNGDQRKRPRYELEDVGNHAQPKQNLHSTRINKGSIASPSNQQCDDNDEYWKRIDYIRNQHFDKLKQMLIILTDSKKEKHSESTTWMKRNLDILLRVLSPQSDKERNRHISFPKTTDLSKIELFVEQYVTPLYDRIQMKRMNGANGIPAAAAVMSKESKTIELKSVSPSMDHILNQKSEKIWTSEVSPREMSMPCPEVHPVQHQGNDYNPTDNHVGETITIPGNVSPISNNTFKGDKD